MPETEERLRAALADRYRLERELGQGGMATVYLAEDLKHGRKVAIKVLHPELSAVIGGERFLAEIKTTASLQHPHILGLIDSGEIDGLLYYVMPWVSGESLRARLEREKQLPVDDALRLAKEVASALDYAHRQGVVHRDIKPENILLQDGSALVADFGIALAVQQAGGQRLTQTGMSLGTPHYMAPEQAMGERDITPRADVYALGAVTYEMLAGEPPFTGPNSQAVVAKVLTETPPALHAKRPTVPVHVEAALQVALQKLPADRFGSAAKFAEALSQPGVAVTPPAPAQRADVSAASPILRAVTAGGALLCVALAWRLGRSSAAPAPAWTQFTQLTDASGVETSPTIAPDGESFAYASDARGTWDIYAQRVGGRNPVLVAGDTTVDEEWPAYSPDGHQIAYAQRGSGIFLVGATGESPRRLTTFGSNPAWSPDGRRIVFASEAVVDAYNVNLQGSLWVVDASGGEPRRLEIPGATDMYEPAWSPSGARLAFWSATGGQRDIETVPAAGGPRTKVTDDAAVDWAPTWSADGRWIYFASDRGGTMGLWRIAMDEASGGPRGTPEAIAAGVDVAMDLPHLSREGTAIVFRSKIESVNPAAIAFDPATGRAGAVTLLQHRSGILVPTDVSPDGRWLALNNTPDRRQDVFVMHPDGSALTRLTDDDARDYFPVFTPDGRSLTWFSNQTGQYQGVSMLVDGSGRRVLTDLPGGASFTRFAPDGTRLLVQPVTGPALIGSQPWPLTEKNASALAGTTIGEESLMLSSWSPDGRFLAGYLTSTSLGLQGHAIYDLETHRARRLNGDSHGLTVAWLPGGRQVAYFTDAGRLVLQDVATLARHEVDVTLPAPPNFDGIIVAAPDGRTLYYGASEVQANIWLVRRAAAPGGTQ
jgi:serine/threonine-protein kinase